MAETALEKSGIKRSYYQTLHSLANQIRAYSGEMTTFAQVNQDYLLGFIDYLRSAQNQNYKNCKKAVKLAPNTQHNLFIKFSYVIRKAYKADIITQNPLEKIELSDKPKSEKGMREFLTIDEVKRLIKTECSNETVKRAFIFCCLSGLRYGDVSKITWSDLWKDNPGNMILRLQISKTKRYEDFPISNEAMNWLPHMNRVCENEQIFPLPKNDNANTALKRWAKAAKIRKSLSFHMARHIHSSYCLKNR